MAETSTVIIKGNQLICPHCKNRQFETVTVTLNKRWLSAFDLEIFGKKGKAYLCTNCGLKQEFYRKE